MNTQCTIHTERHRKENSMFKTKVFSGCTYIKNITFPGNKSFLNYKYETGTERTIFFVTKNFLTKDNNTTIGTGKTCNVIRYIYLRSTLSLNEQDFEVIRLFNYGFSALFVLINAIVHSVLSREKRN